MTIGGGFTHGENTYTWPFIICQKSAKKGKCPSILDAFLAYFEAKWAKKIHWSPTSYLLGLYIADFMTS